MGYEDKALAVINGQQTWDIRLTSFGPPLIRQPRPVLQQVAPVVLGFRGFDLEGNLLRKPVQIGKDTFELVCRGQIRELAATGRNQEKSAPQHDAKLAEQRRHVIQVVEIAP